MQTLCQDRLSDSICIESLKPSNSGPQNFFAIKVPVFIPAFGFYLDRFVFCCRQRV